MSEAATLPRPVSVPAEYRAAGAILLAGLALLGLMFASEIAAGVRVWTNSTAYNHCFFVIPIAAYIAWDRRALFSGVLPRPTPILALAAVPLAAAWLFAERVGILEGRQLIAMCLVQVLFMAVLGLGLWRRMSAALLYLFFLVPFGAFFVPLLQTVTARFTVAGLNLLGIPNFSDGFTIDIPEGSFYVAEACAGLRFLIASVAFGALYASVMYRSPVRRLAFLAASVVIPVVANGIRATGIVVLGHVLGSAEAAAADHVLYGWIFFSIVMFLLILVGAPFRQEPHILTPRPMPAPARPFTLGAALLAAAAVVLIAGSGRLVALALDRAADAPPEAVPLAFNAGVCQKAAPADGVPAGATVFACDAGTLRFQAVVFPARTSLSQIASVRRRLAGETEGADADTSTLRIHGVDWRLSLAEDPPDAVATALWINGAPAQGGLRTRIEQARNSLFGADRAPVLSVLRPEIDWRREGILGQQRARVLVQTFLQSQPQLGSQLAAAAADPAWAAR